MKLERLFEEVLNEVTLNEMTLNKDNTYNDKLDLKKDKQKYRRDNTYEKLDEIFDLFSKLRRGLDQNEDPYVDIIERIRMCIMILRENIKQEEFQPASYYVNIWTRSNAFNF